MARKAKATFPLEIKKSQQLGGIPRKCPSESKKGLLCGGLRKTQNAEDVVSAGERKTEGPLSGQNSCKSAGETKGNRAAFRGGRDILKHMEFLDGVYYEDPYEQIRERQGIFNPFGPLCYSAGLWSNPI